MQAPEARRKVLFLGAGLLNTAFGFAAYALSIRAGAPVWLALVLSTVSGVFFNFFTSRVIVFRSRRASLWRFLMTYAVVYLVNLVLISLLKKQGLGPIWAGLLVLPIAVGISYLMQSRWVFTEGPDG